MTEQASPIIELPTQRTAPASSSAMLSHLSAWHQSFYARRLRRIQIEGEGLARAAELSKSAQIIYVSPELSLLDYLFFNVTLLERGLPLSQFTRNLHTWAWQPWPRKRAAWQLHREQRDFDPIGSGFIHELVRGGHSLMLQLRTSMLYDDRLWADPNSDILLAAARAAEESNRPTYIVPLQLLWGTRPESSEWSLRDVLFGTQASPLRLRKAWRFLRHSDKAVCVSGEPIHLQQLIADMGEVNDTKLAQNLRQHVLAHFTQSRKSFLGPKLKPKRWMVEQTLEAERVQTSIYETVRHTGRSYDDVTAVARSYAEEIGSETNYTAVEIIARALGWILYHIYDGVDYEEEALGKLREAIARGPVVLVPNHRSHIDGLILSYVLYKNNIALPQVAGGINLAFWPAGGILRRCGVFFLRRSFRGNTLYRDVFSAYLQQLVSDGHSMVFFIEGGRSRTGKSLQPRLGMLAMLGEAWEAEPTLKLQFMPVGITHDHIIEQNAHIHEIEGGAKEKESGLALLKVGKHLRQRYGRIYLRWGKTIEYADLQTTQTSKEATTAELAAQLMRRIHQLAVVTPVALVATAVLADGRTGIPAQTLRAHCRLLLNILRARGAAQAPELAQDASSAIDAALEHLVRTRQIARHDAFAPHFYQIIDRRRRKLDLSRNSIIHLLVSPACLCASLQRHYQHGRSTTERTKLREDYQRFQQLFAQEFRFSTRESIDAHLDRHLATLSSLGFISMDNERITVLENRGDDLAHLAAVLQSYLESYYLVLCGARSILRETRTEEELLKLLDRYAEHHAALGQISRPESISRITFRNAIRRYRELELITVHNCTQAGSAEKLLWNESATPQVDFQAWLEEFV